MAYDISGLGLAINLRASVNFPQGFTITALADDADPFDIPSVAIGDAAVGANGDLVKWAALNPIDITLNVIPLSDDDKNLSALFNANAPGRGKTLSRDELTLTVVYPSGSTLVLSDGACLEWMPGEAWAQGGRLKTKPYQMRFGTVTKS